MSQSEPTAPDGGETASAVSPPATSLAPIVAGITAWLVPGLGHWLLGRRARGATFFVLVAGALVLGAVLEGNLGTSLQAPPLTVLRTLACMAAGLPYAFLRFVIGYMGSAQAPGYEYGSAFLVSAGLMNLMLALDAFDIAAGRKA